MLVDYLVSSSDRHKSVGEVIAGDFEITSFFSDKD